jgi:murein L,D-transpeptidase YcbB/YkuD
MNYLKKSTHKTFFTFLVDFLILLFFSFVGFVFIQAETFNSNKSNFKKHSNTAHYTESNYIKSNPFDSSNYSQEYQLLYQKLNEYNELLKNKRWDNIINTKNEFKIGDSSEILINVKNQLYLLGDIEVTNQSKLFDSSLFYGVKNFQNRYGLKSNGKLTKQTLLQLNRPIETLIKTIKLNLTRIKLELPKNLEDYVVVNLPEFKLHTYYYSEETSSYKVIIGKTTKKTQTKIFNDSIEYLVFCPYWNIPKGIIIKEILPEIKKNKNFLHQNNMEVTTHQGEIIPSTRINWSIYTKNFPYAIRQRPGKKNALGKVKFLFPNPYSIYIHDTPEKKLFSKETRTFSHGCIRVETPLKLAFYLLRYNKNYSQQKINQIVKNGKQTYIKLKNKVPIYITYYTTWVDSSGKLNFRYDIYDRD